MKRRQYVTFFGGSRRRDIFGSEGSRIGWILPVLILAAGFTMLVIWLVGGDDAPTGTLGDGSPVPSVLFPISTTTTLPAVTESVSCPGAVVGWPTFHGSGDRAGCVSAPHITDPSIMWTANIGVQGWLNNPVISDGIVYVGSAGSAQFESDGSDGVYAIDVLTGDTSWFFAATLDVNGVSVSEGIVVAVGDEGAVWGIDAATGSQIWANNVGVPVFGSPLFVGSLVVVGDGSGSVTALDATTGERRWVVDVEGALRGGATTDGEAIYAIGEQRDAVAVDLDGNLLWRTTISPTAPNASSFRIYAAPTVVDGRLIVTLVRDDVYPEPAMVAIDAATGRLDWEAVDTAGIKSQWGNVRSAPAVVGDLLVYAEPYFDGIVAIDMATGQTQWEVTAGAFCFPQWPSPAVNDGLVIVGRHDGGLYAVDAVTGTLSWSIYLGDHDADGVFPDGFGEGFCDWTPVEGFSVLASPAVDDSGIVVVGTLEGYLVAVGDSSW